MDKIAQKYADQDVGSYFLYTHEAHPGEEFPHHTSMEQKFRHAEALREGYGVTRPIMVDTLTGLCHRAFGSMPNMVWIFNRAGIAIYKADWTDADSVENAVSYYLDVSRRRKNREKLAPFQVQRLDYRVQDYDRFYEGLERSGPKAVQEFSETFPEKRPKKYR